MYRLFSAHLQWKGRIIFRRDIVGEEERVHAQEKEMAQDGRLRTGSRYGIRQLPGRFVAGVCRRNCHKCRSDRNFSE